MKYKEIEYSSFLELYFDILPSGNLGTKLDGFVFRGESSAKRQLLPSIFRPNGKYKIPEWDAMMFEFENFQEDYIMVEYYLMKHFFIEANKNGLKIPNVQIIKNNYLNTSEWPAYSNKKHKWIDDELVELVALAQHYGVVTRMLDWTSDINVAFYFAALGACKRKRDSFKEISSKYDDTDKLVVWAVNARLIELGKNSLNPIPLKFVVPPYSDNPNLNAQKGVLSYWEVDYKVKKLYGQPRIIAKDAIIDMTPLDEQLKKYCKENLDDDILLYKILLPVEDCIEMFSFLNKTGYDASRLFPGYDGVAKKINEDLLVSELNTIKFRENNNQSDLNYSHFVLTKGGTD